VSWNDTTHHHDRPEEAIRFLTAAVAIRPRSASPHVGLGNTLWMQRRSAETEAECLVALRLQPDNPLAHNNLGNALSDQGRPVEAEAAYREAIRLDPSYI
jgi:tetratricopeptide (TPR) repeat protein